MGNIEREQQNRSRTSLVLGAVLALLASAFAIGFMASQEDSDVSPVVNYAPATTPLNEFAARCEKGFDDWRSAQFTYPETLRLVAGTPSAYLATVDVRDIPLPAEQLVPGTDSQSASIAVRCVVSARIVADQSIVVDPPEWTPRHLNAAGIMNWSWSITANTTGHHDLRLELQPAVAASSDSEVVFAGGSPEQTLTFLTNAAVGDPPSSPRPQPRTVWQWVGDNWPAITTVIGGVAVAVLASVKWLSDLGPALRQLRKAWRRPSKANTPRRRQRDTARAESKTKQGPG